MGHALMENRNGLVVDACLTPADGHAERVAAAHLSVRGNLRYGQRRALKNGVAERFRFDEVVRQLSIGHLLDRSTGELSGGERAWCRCDGRKKQVMTLALTDSQLRLITQASALMLPSQRDRHRSDLELSARRPATLRKKRETQVETAVSFILSNFQPIDAISSPLVIPAFFGGSRP
jgi:hypothetical protein